MEMFSLISGSQTPRRAWLFMPLAFAGAAAVFNRRERPVPGPAQNGSGAATNIVLFRDNGERGETIRVNKIEKSDAEWRRELTADEFAVARKKGTERACTGRYWTNHDAGADRCLCCCTTLFRRGENLGSRHAGRSFYS